MKVPTPLQLSAQWLTQNFLKLFESFLFKNQTREEINLEIEIQIEKDQAKLAAIALAGGQQV